MRVRCFDFATILGVAIAIAVGVVTVILISFQLANKTTLPKQILSNIQELKETVNAIRLELGSIQGNNTKQFCETTSSTASEPATTSAPSTEQATTVTPTTQPSDVCGGTGTGWRRVAFIDMTDPNQDCPQRLRLTN